VITDNATVKEKLMALSDIDTDAIKGMSAKQLLSYVQALNVTVAAYPLQKEELVHAFLEMDYATVFQWLQLINSSLSQMHADELVKECEKHIAQNQDLNAVRHDRVKVFIDYFIPTLDLFIAEVYQVLDDIEALEVEEVEKQHELDPEKIKEKLLTINELNSDMISKMSDSQLAEYIQILNTFHSDFQAQENGLRGSIKIKHYVFVLQWLSTIEETLIKLRAMDLARDCLNHININKDFNNIRHEKLEVFINYLLSSMSMLSADIKMLHLPKELRTSDDKEGTPEHIEVEVELLSPGSSPEAKTVLIINKMTMFMNSFKNALGDVPHKLIGVTTAEATVNYLKTAKPDLFVLDEDLPGTDVYVLVKIIRATGQLAPIVFTTSTITKDKMAKFMEAGVADFIAKPITPADVQKKIKKHLPES